MSAPKLCLEPREATSTEEIDRLLREAIALWMDRNGWPMSWSICDASMLWRLEHLIGEAMPPSIVDAIG